MSHTAKKCSKCKEEKPLTIEFFALRVDRCTKDGFRGVCRKCINERTLKLKRKKYGEPKKKPVGYWTKEKILEDAAKYVKSSDWRKNSKGAYVTALKLGIVEEVTNHMVKRKPDGYWTKERILEDAKRFSHAAEWREHSSTAYTYSFHTEGLYEEATSHMERISTLGIKKPKTEENGWTEERRKATWGRPGEQNHNWQGGISIGENKKNYHRDKYKQEREKAIELFNQGLSFEEIRQTYGNLARRLPHRMWPEEELKKKAAADKKYREDTYVKKPNKYGHYKHQGMEFISLEECKAEALKHEMISSLSGARGYPSTIYVRIKQKGWEKECFSHMIPALNLAKRQIYACEFPQNNKAYIGLSCEVEERFLAHQGKGKRSHSKSPVYNFTLKSGEQPVFKILTEPIPSEQAQEEEAGYIEKYKEEGWEMLNQKSAGGLGLMRRKWTKEKFLEDRKNHPEVKTVKEFYNIYYKDGINKKDKIHWIRALVKRNGWTEEVERGLTIDASLHKWTKEKVLEIALTCKNISEMQKKYSGAYKHVKREGYQKELVFNNVTPRYWDCSRGSF
tara:strand:+ start:589 stop:2277 length:1689 start_codon:yes stop_codon:yes gene_type:complete